MNLEIKIGDVTKNQTQEFEIKDNNYPISNTFTLCLDNIKREYGKNVILEHLIKLSIAPYREVLEKYIDKYGIITRSKY